VVDAMLKKPGRKLAEYEMALRADLTPTNWKAPDVWVRGIADILIVDDENLTAWVGDWKTGNNKYPDRDQLVLMSLMVFQHFPHIRKVNSALLFIVKNDMVKMSMARDDADKHWWDYRERTARLEASFAICVEPKSNATVRLVPSKDLRVQQETLGETNGFTNNHCCRELDTRP
jgi:hypothetical protein